MDRKLFNEKLSQVADWYIPIVSERSVEKKMRKPMPDSQPNVTMGPVIENLKPCLRACEWCRKIVDQKTSHSLRVGGKRAGPQWEHKCDTCKMVWDSKTGELRRTQYQEDKLKGKTKPKTAWRNDPANYTISDKENLG